MFDDRPAGTPAPPPVARDVVGRRVAAGTAPTGDFTYTVVEAERPQRLRADRRGESRARTRLREGEVAESRGRVLVECRIRDLSRRGARLQLDKDRPLPKAFLLREAGAGRSYWATLIWQKGCEAGVRLLVVE